MARLTVAEFEEAIRHFDREALHLEMRDSYGTEVELPHMARWAAGEPDDYAWFDDYVRQVRANVAAGKSYRRVHVVSEPLSDYQRWSHSLGRFHVGAGWICAGCRAARCRRSRSPATISGCWTAQR